MLVIAIINITLMMVSAITTAINVSTICGIIAMKFCSVMSLPESTAATLLLFSSSCCCCCRCCCCCWYYCYYPYCVRYNLRHLVTTITTVVVVVATASTALLLPPHSCLTTVITLIVMRVLFTTFESVLVGQHGQYTDPSCATTAVIDATNTAVAIVVSYCRSH